MQRAALRHLPERTANDNTRRLFIVRLCMEFIKYYIFINHPVSPLSVAVYNL